MKTEKIKTHKFLVLVPHRDIRIELKKSCDLSLKAGLVGVYDFPRVVPLISLSQSLNDGELKQIARSLREVIGKNKIFTEEDDVTAFPCYEKKFTLCGPRLDTVIPQDVFYSGGKKINSIFPSLVIGCFLKPEINCNASEDNTKLNVLYKIMSKKMGFRAAAIANMYWRTLKVNGEIYYKWKIGKLCWLPHP